MSDPAIDVVEHALREHYGAPETRDVTWRVLAALGATEPMQRRAFPRRAVVAALLVAIAGALWFAQARPPRAHSSAPVAVHSSDGALTRTSALRAHRIAYASEPARLELPDGIALELASGTVFRWSHDDPVLEVFAGAIEVASSEDQLVVGSPTGSLVLAARSRARFEVTPPHDLVSPNQLARSLSMNLRLTVLAPTVTATLLAGSGTLLCGGPPHTLVVAQPSVVDPAYAEPRPAHTQDEDDLNPFALEPGVWNLHEPHDAAESTGVETVRVGPHPHSLLVDMSSKANGSGRAAHVVLKYEPSGRITGSLVDSFGGPIGVFRGELDEDGGRRLELYRVDGEPFGMRMLMRWIDDDERRTVLQSEQDGEWHTVQETAHRRRTD